MSSQNLALRLLVLLGALLLIKVSIAIVGNYSLYFPPNFEQGFLEGRAQIFVGLYRLAFYGHIVVGPICMAIGTVQLTPWSRRTAKLHRGLGRLQLLLILLRTTKLAVPPGISSIFGKNFGKFKIACRGSMILSRPPGEACGLSSLYCSFLTSTK